MTPTTPTILFAGSLADINDHAHDADWDADSDFGSDDSSGHSSSGDSQQGTPPTGYSDSVYDFDTRTTPQSSGLTLYGSHTQIGRLTTGGRHQQSIDDPWEQSTSSNEKIPILSEAATRHSQVNHRSPRPAFSRSRASRALQNTRLPSQPTVFRSTERPTDLRAGRTCGLTWKAGPVGVTSAESTNSMAGSRQHHGSSELSDPDWLNNSWSQNVTPLSEKEEDSKVASPVLSSSSGVSVTGSPLASLDGQSQEPHSVGVKTAIASIAVTSDSTDSGPGFFEKTWIEEQVELDRVIDEESATSRTLE